MKKISDLNLLITRPQQQAESLAIELAKLGATATVFPTLEIHPILVDFVLPIVDKIIFISQNAVENSVALDPIYWQEIAKKSEIISMGSGTSEALRQYGINQIIEPESFATSETLLALPTLTSIVNKKILIIAGIGGRELLVETLVARGASVEKIAVYRRSKPAQVMPHWPIQFDAVISTSGESLMNFKTMALESNQSFLLDLPFLVVSQRMVELADQLGFTGKKLLAAGASNKAIIHQLRKL